MTAGEHNAPGSGLGGNRIQGRGTPEVRSDVEPGTTPADLLAQPLPPVLATSVRVWAADYPNGGRKAFEQNIGPAARDDGLNASDLIVLWYVMSFAVWRTGITGYPLSIAKIGKATGDTHARRTVGSLRRKGWLIELAWCGKRGAWWALRHPLGPALDQAERGALAVRHAALGGDLDAGRRVVQELGR